MPCADDAPRTPPTLDAVSRRLDGLYGRPAPVPDRPVLDGLIYTILSQNTTAPNTRLAYARLREAYPEWAAVLDAAPEDLADAIRPAGLADTRAPRIQAVLTRILGDFGELSLEALREWTSEEVRAYLTGLPGVGVKTAACVVLFDLGRPEFPVDTHVHRLARRLGWVPEEAGRDETYRRLNPVVPEDDRHALHINLIRHGRAVCRARQPQCRDCVLLDLCPEGRARTAEC